MSPLQCICITKHIRQYVRALFNTHQKKSFTLNKHTHKRLLTKSHLAEVCLVEGASPNLGPSRGFIINENIALRTWRASFLLLSNQKDRFPDTRIMVHPHVHTHTASRSYTELHAGKKSGITGNKGPSRENCSRLADG